MNSNTGGQTSDLQRKAAAAIARKKVLAAYAEMAQKNALNSAPNAADAPGTESAYAAPNAEHMKDEPINPRINSESWKRYHTAWQDYYQKYYSE